VRVTVLVNERRVNSCLTLAVSCEGERVTTIEGLGDPEHLHPMQAAFLEHDGFQCGYCTRDRSVRRSPCWKRLARVARAQSPRMYERSDPWS